MPAGIASIHNAAVRPLSADSTDPMSVIQWTGVVRRSVLHLSIDMCCGHLRGRVTAVGRQLEVLFTTPMQSLGACIRADAPAVWRAKPRQGSRLRFGFSARLCEPGALRYSVSWPRRGTHCAHCVRYVQTVATSQSTKRAARAATSLPFLGVEQALRRLPCRAFARCSLAHSQAAHHECREDGAGGRSGACAAPSTAVQRGESGAQRRTGEKSLWAGASSAGAGGIAAAPRSEERREPVAQRRALQRSRCAHPPRPCAHATKRSAATTANGCKSAVANQAHSFENTEEAS